MRARGLPIAAAIVLAATAAAGEPKPRQVDIKPFRDHLIVLQDAQGATYVVDPAGDGRAFYGTGKSLYEQIVVSRSRDGEANTWDIGVFAPRVPQLRPGSIMRKSDGTYHRFCDAEDVVLTERTGEQARSILDRSAFMTPAAIRAPRALARDDAGVYYYVDQIRPQFGGNGMRVFVGKKGMMKEMPLVDATVDSGGAIFSTKSGELRLVLDSEPPRARWARGDKVTELKMLDVDVNSPLIFRDLGVYGFIGTICENL
jgi:hypothetical protein